RPTAPGTPSTRRPSAAGPSGARRAGAGVSAVLMGFAHLLYLPCMLVGSGAAARPRVRLRRPLPAGLRARAAPDHLARGHEGGGGGARRSPDRKSTRLN